MTDSLPEQPITRPNSRATGEDSPASLRMRIAELELQLARREALLSDVRKRLPLALYAVRHDLHQVEFFTSRAAELLGLSAEESPVYFDAASYARRIHPEDRREVIAVRRGELARVQKGKPVEGALEYRWLREGQYIWLRHVYCFHADASGRMVAENGSIEDITDRKESEQELHRSRDRFRDVLDSSQVVHYRYNLLEDRLEYVGQAVQEVMGISREEALQGTRGTHERRIHPEDLPRWRQMVQWALESSKSRARYQILYRHRRGDGQMQWLSEWAEILHDADGTAVAVVGTLLDVTAEQQGKEALRRSEQNLRLALECANGWTWDWDISSDIVTCSEGCRETLGLGEGPMEFTRELWQDVMHPEDQPEFLRRLQEHLDGKTDVFEAEYRNRKADGEYLWLVNRGRVVERDPAGKPVRLVGMAMDITERKVALQRVRRGEQRLRESMEASRDGFWELNCSNRQLWGSARCSEILGLGDHEQSHLVDRWVQQIHPHDRQRTLDALEAHLADFSKTFMLEFRVLLVNGKTRWAQNRGRVVEWDADGNPVRMMGVTEDITERKEAEQALAESEERYRTLFQAVPVALFRTTVDGRFLAANQRLIEMLGHDRIEAIWDLSVVSIYANPADREELLRRLEQDGEVEALEVPIRRSDGKEIWAQINARAVYDGEGNIRQIEGSASDVTDRRLAESALQDSEARNRAILQAIPDIMFLLDRGGVVLDYHAPHEETLYLLPEEFLGRPITETMPESVANHLMRGLGEVEYGQPPVFVVYSLLMSSAQHYFEARMVAMQDGRTLVIVRDITESRRSAEALRASEERYRNLVEGVRDIIYAMTPEGIVISLNPAFDAITDWHRDEWIGQSIGSLVHPDDREVLWQHHTATLRGDRVGPQEVRFRTRQGEFITLEFRTTVQRDGDKALGLWGVARDITDRKRAEEALRRTRDELEHRVVERTEDLRRREQQEREFREKLTSLHEVSIALSRAETMDVLCRRAVELAHDVLGFDRVGIWFCTDEPGGIRGSYGINERGAIRDERHRRLVVRNETTLKVLVEGGVVVSQDAPVFDDVGQPLARGTRMEACMWAGDEIIGFVTVDNLLRRNDMTSMDREILTLFAAMLGPLCFRTRTQQKLEDSEQRYRNIVETTADWVWAVDTNGEVTFSNRAVEEILGYTPEEILQTPNRPRIHPEDREEAHLRFERCLREKCGWERVELRYVHNDGSVRYIESTGRPVFDTGGVIVGFTGIDRDITRRRKTEEQLRAAHLQLLTAREQERRHVASELHDSVAQNLVALQLQLRQEASRENSGEALSRLTDSCASIIGEIRHICYDLFPPMLDTLGMHASMTDLANRYAGTDIHVGVHVPTSLENVRFSPEVEIALFRIFQEGVSNAVRHGRAKHIELVLRLHDDDLLGEVIDDGPGFDPDTAVGGMGLASMRDRAEMIGGTLQFLRRDDRTVVQVTVPLAKVGLTQHQNHTETS